MAEPTYPTTLTVQSDRILHVPSVHLIVTHPTGAETAHALQLAPLHIGSGAGCDIVIHDSRVSRRHCRIQLTQEGIVIRDLGSKNGTYVGHVRVIEALLSEGMEISLGAARAIVTMAGPPLQIPIWQKANFGPAVGASLVMRAVFAQLDYASRLANPLLLYGESGSGKSILAIAVHTVSGRGGKYVVLNCAEEDFPLHSHDDATPVFSADQIETAFLEAVGGSIEICNPDHLPQKNQRQLLELIIEAFQGRNRYSRYGAGSVRIITTCNHDPPSLNKLLLPEFAGWLSSVFVRVPPLREHGDDIPLLVDRFVAQWFAGATRDILPPGTMTMLLSSPWTRNVRELANVIKAVAMASLEGQSIILAASRNAKEGVKLGRLGRLSYREAKNEVDEVFTRMYVTEKLREQGSNVQRAAESSGVSRVHFHRLMKECGIQRKDLDDD